MCNVVVQKAGARTKVKPFIYPTPKINNNKNNENAFVYPTPKIDNISNINNVIETNNNSGNSKNNRKKNENNNNKNGIGSIEHSKKENNVFCEMSKNKGEKKAMKLDSNNDNNNDNNNNNNNNNSKECDKIVENGENDAMFCHPRSCDEKPFVYPTPKSNNINNYNVRKKNENENENKNGIREDLNNSESKMGCEECVLGYFNNESENESEYDMDRNVLNGDGVCINNGECCILGMDLDCNDNNNNNSKKSESVYGLENANIDININKFITTQGKEMNGINDRNDRKNHGIGDEVCTNSGGCIIGMDFDCNNKCSKKSDKIGENESIYTGKEMDENEN